MNTLRTLLQSQSNVEPSVLLRDRILTAITREEYHLIKRREQTVLFGVVLSLGLFLTLATEYSRVLLQSDFWSLAALLFSDLGIVITTSQDFLYSLLETLPLVPLISLLLPLTVFFWLLSLFLSLRSFEKEKFDPHAFFAH
jgi:hypothetical protein